MKRLAYTGHNKSFLVSTLLQDRTLGQQKIEWSGSICTLNVIAGDPPCKNDNARFTTEPLKALFDQV